MTIEFPRKLPVEALKILPWKNGRGMTTEIAAGPPRSDDQDWSWRVSIADVPATGPFSRFPGIDRTIAVIEGDGMDLRFEDGRMVPLEPNQPIDFAGDVAVDGILRTDPIRDFNVMTDRRHFSAVLKIGIGGDDVACKIAKGGVLLIHVLDGEGNVVWGDGYSTAINQSETLIYDWAAEVSVSIAPGSRVAIVALEEAKKCT